MHDEFNKYVKTYKPNAFLVKEGDEDTSFYCLLEGKVGIWKGNPSDRDALVKIGELGEKGTYFGEMSVLLDEPRTASILAMEEPVKALCFPGDMLSAMMLKQPKLGLKICTALANRLRGATRRQQEVAQERNEIRDDATSQFLYARQQFQKVFVMLTTIQTRIQNQDLKAVIEYMSRDKLLQGGKKIRVNEDFLEDIPTQLYDSVKQTYQSLI